MISLPPSPRSWSEGQGAANLFARGLSILLVVYTIPFQHMVLVLAQRIDVSKPSLTLTLSRHEVLDLVRHDPDYADRRSVLIPPDEGWRRPTWRGSGSLPRSLS